MLDRIVAVERSALDGELAPANRFKSKWTKIERIRSLGGLVGASLLGKVITADSQAATIRIKNNVLAFYPDRSLVVKVFENETSWHSQLKGYSWAAHNFTFIRVPRIIEAQLEPHAFTCENLITGTKPSRDELLACEGPLLDDLETLHFSEPEIGHLVLRHETISACITKLHQARIPVPRQLYRLVEAGEIVVPVGIGNVHGDLTRGNMRLRGTNLWLMDWERFSRDAVARDARKLIGTIPGLIARYDASMQRLAREQNMALPPLADQLAACLVHDIATGKYSRSYFANRGRLTSWPSVLQSLVERIEEGNLGRLT